MIVNELRVVPAGDKLKVVTGDKYKAIKHSDTHTHDCIEADAESSKQTQKEQAAERKRRQRQREKENGITLQKVTAKLWAKIELVGGCDSLFEYVEKIEAQNEKLEREIEFLKNRGFWARLRNKL